MAEMKATWAIADFLSHGQNNAQLLRDLCAMLDMDEREIRAKIQQERKQGIPILSDNVHGYFLPNDSMEVERFVHSMRGRAAEICAVADAVERGCSQ